MAQNLELIPENRDYVLSASGSPIPSDRAFESTYFAITIPQGQWLYGAPNQGSKLFTLNNVKRTASIEQQIAGYVSDAIDRQVIASGQVLSERFQNIQATRSGTVDQVTIYPNQIELSNKLDFVAV